MTPINIRIETIGDLLDVLAPYAFHGRLGPREVGQLAVIFEALEDARAAPVPARTLSVDERRHIENATVHWPQLDCRYPWGCLLHRAEED